MRHIAALVILCLSWLQAVEAGPGTLTYYPETYAVTGTISATAAGSRGLVVAGSAISLLGQPAGSIALYNNGVASTLYTSGTCAAVDADKNGVIVALVAGSGGQQTLLRSTTAAPTFQEVPLPGFRTSPTLDATHIRITPDGGFLVVGSFQTQPGVSRPSIVAQWSLTSGWNCLDGLTGKIGDLICDGQGRILAGGLLNVLGTGLNLARYDAGTWTPVTVPTGWPSGFNDPLFGNFTGIKFSHISSGDPVIITHPINPNQDAVWLPSAGTWSSVVALSNQRIDALAMDGADAPVALIGSAAQRWANGAWTPLAGITRNVSYVSTLVSTGGNGLAVTGSWSSGIRNDPLLLWDGTTWNNLGGDDIHPSQTANGWLTEAGDLVVADSNRLLRHDGSKWNLFANDPGLSGGCISTFKTTSGYGILSQSGIAIWNGSSWAITSANGNKRALPLNNGNVIVGGKFTMTTSEGTANNIARWDGSQWHRLGGGTGGEVTALVEQTDGSLVVAGNFTVVDGDLPMPPGLAMWNGSTWSRLNEVERPAGSITALGHDVNGDLVIGLGRYSYDKYGSVIGVYEKEVPLVYRWRNGAWSPLGVFTGYSPDVRNFVQDGRGGLIAQGNFIIADSIPMNGLARWDGNAWNSLGATVTSNDPVMESAQGIVGTSWGKIGRWTAPKILMSSLRSDSVSGRNFGTTADRQPTVFGTGIPGQGFSIRQGSTTVLTSTVDANGRWSATLPGTWPDGSNTVTFVPADASIPSQTAGFSITSSGGSGGGTGTTADSGGGGGGCGSGAGVAVVLGAFLLARRKRAA